MCTFTRQMSLLRPMTALSARLLGALMFCSVPTVLSAHGTHGQLMEVVNRKLESSPADANLWFQRGFLNLEHEDPAQALEDLAKAEAFAPGKLPTLLLKGQALELSGKLPEAKSALDAHVLRFPDDARGYSTRARVLVKLGAHEDALADYRIALAKSPDAEPDLVQEAAVALEANGHQDEAIKVIEAGLKRLGAIPSLTIKALEFEVKAGHYDQALARVEVIRKSAPRPEPWMAKRAELLDQARRSDESRAAWQTLINHLASLPNLERGSNAMSLLAEQARQALANVAITDRRRVTVPAGALHEEGIELRNDHITAMPDDPALWHERGMLLLADGQFQQALLDCDETERLAPGKFPTGYIRSQVLLATGELEKGRVALDEFLTGYPDHLAGRALRARLFLQSRQPEAALADYRAVLQSNSSTANTELVLEAVNALAENGRCDEATAVLNTRISKQGAVPELLTRSLELEAARGNYDAAISRVDALAKTATQPECWMAKRADLLARAGRVDDARTAWLTLKSHLNSLPNLQRGQPTLLALAREAECALEKLDSISSSKAPKNPIQ